MQIGPTTAGREEKMDKRKSFPIALVLCLLFPAFAIVPAAVQGQEEEDEHMQERPNPEEHSISPDDIGFGSKVRDKDPSGPVTAPGGEKLRGIDPSAPVVSPASDKFRGIDPAGPVVSPGISKGKSGGKQSFQPQPEPPGSPFLGAQVLSTGERVQFVATGMKRKAYIMKGGKRLPLADGSYALGGGEGFSVKMGVVMEDKLPKGPLSPAASGKSSPKAIIDDGKPGTKAIIDDNKPATKAIIDDGKPDTKDLGGGGGGGVGPRGIVIQDRNLPQLQR